MSCFNCFGDDSSAAVKMSKPSIGSGTGGGSIKSKRASSYPFSGIIQLGSNKSLMSSGTLWISTLAGAALAYKMLTR
jgi:hypothetical protein